MSRRLFRKRKKPPRELRRWLDDPGVTPRWDRQPTEVVAATRAQLFEEQAGLCCYCYGRLSGTEEDHREHVVPKAARELDDFDWSNLALACEGGNRSKRPRHCDHAKGEQRLRVVHPHRRPVVELARVGSDGKLRPDGGDAEHDVVEILRLNQAHLVTARQARIQAAIRDLETTARRDDARWKARRLSAALAELREPPAVDLEPWTEQWLERQLASGRS